VLNEYAGVQQGVVDGLGISEVPSFICEAPLNDGRLVEVLPEWRFATITMAATCPGNRYLSPLVRAFKDFAQSTSNTGRLRSVSARDVARRGYMPEAPRRQRQQMAASLQSAFDCGAIPSAVVCEASGASHRTTREAVARV
jgi:LysR substrate binding domain